MTDRNVELQNEATQESAGSVSADRRTVVKGIAAAGLGTGGPCRHT